MHELIRENMAMRRDKPTILIVDDEPSITNLLFDYLVEEGYNCITASTGEDALTKSPITHTDLVLLDLRLPGISGMDVLRQLVSMRVAPPIIVLTAVADAKSIIEAMKIGAVDYIIKPFKLEEVNDSIKRVLERFAFKENMRVCYSDSAIIKESEPDWTVYLDCIARSVQIRLESETRQAMTVIERTAAIAFEMDIPEKDIARWVEDRQRKNAEEVEFMSSLLRKLEANPLAQVLLGITDLRDYEPEEYNQN